MNRSSLIAHGTASGRQRGLGRICFKALRHPDKSKVIRQEDILDTTSTFSSSLQLLCLSWMGTHQEFPWTQTQAMKHRQLFGPGCKAHSPSPGTSSLEFFAPLSQALQRCTFRMHQKWGWERHTGLSADKSEGQSAGRSHPIWRKTFAQQAVAISQTLINFC